LSTLTKVLIVLLTVFSIFLCGIVVTYVANADDQRQKAADFEQRWRSARASQQDALADLEQQKQATEDLKAELGAQISEQGNIITQLQGQLDNIKRENAQLVQSVANMGKDVAKANETARLQIQQFEKAQEEVKNLLADQTKRNKELQERTQTLMEKMAVIAQLEDKNKRLTEQNKELEGRINNVLQQYGRVATMPEAVTRVRATAKPAEPPAKDIGLNARVTAVDPKNQAAQISIGSAAGVKQGMRFHVVRGEQFVCDILILDVAPDMAAGILELVQTQPRAGDRATTNL
jgi:myosin heavy subunit